MTNIEVIKEPRGFIKFIEIVLAICAFATATGPHLTTSSTCECSGNKIPNNDTFVYPYEIYRHVFKAPICENSTKTEYKMSGDCKAASEFYVFVGVVVFLYSLGAVIAYVVAHEMYSGLEIIPKADFIITIVFTLLWLISSSAFADALSKIKRYTDPEWAWTSDESSFYKYYKDHESQGLKCTAVDSANYATLNVSVIFGFLNMIVWAGNNWFLYKETKWFNSDSSQPSMPTSTSEIEPKV